MSKKRTLWMLLGTMMIAAMLITACGGGGATEESLEGQTVTIFTAAADEQAAAFQSEFVQFTEETGIEVVVEGSGDFEVLTTTRAEAGDLPDIINFPQPGLMADMARDGNLIDLSSFLKASRPSFLIDGSATPSAFTNPGKCP